MADDDPKVFDMFFGSKEQSIAVLQPKMESENCPLCLTSNLCHSQTYPHQACAALFQNVQRLAHVGPAVFVFVFHEAVRASQQSR